MLKIIPKRNLHQLTKRKRNYIRNHYKKELLSIEGKKKYLEWILGKLRISYFGKYSYLSFAITVDITKENLVNIFINIKANTEDEIKEIFHRIKKGKNNKNIDMDIIKNISCISTVLSSGDENFFSTEIFEKNRKNSILNNYEKQLICKEITDYFFPFWRYVIKDVNHAMFELQTNLDKVVYEYAKEMEFEIES